MVRPYNLYDSVDILPICQRTRNALIRNDITKVYQLFNPELIEKLNKDNIEEFIPEKRDLWWKLLTLKGYGRRAQREIEEIFIGKKVITKNYEKNIDDIKKDQTIDFKTILQELNNLILSLEERDKEVIEGRLIYKKTLQEISEKWGISKERVRQIEDKIHKKIDRFIAQYRNNISSLIEQDQYFEIFNIRGYKGIINENYIIYILKDCIDGELFYYNDDIILLRNKEYCNILRNLIEKNYNPIYLYNKLKYLERQGKEVSLITKYLKTKLGNETFSEIDKQLNLSVEEIDNLIYEIMNKTRLLFNQEDISINFLVYLIGGKKNYTMLKEYNGCLKYYKKEEIRNFINRVVENKGLEIETIERLGMKINCIRINPFINRDINLNNCIIIKILHVCYEIMDQFGEKYVAKSMLINFCKGSKKYTFKQEYYGCLGNLTEKDIENNISTMVQMGLIIIKDINFKKFYNVPSIIITPKGEAYYKEHSN